MPETVLERLESLRVDTDAASMSEVVRRSLALYEFVCRRRECGDTLVIRASDGAETNLELL